MSRLSPLAFLLFAACGPAPPALDARLSEQARNAPYPELLPLSPLLRQSDRLLPRNAAEAGTSLEARAADLRRRAAALRRMPL